MKLFRFKHLKDHTVNGRNRGGSDPFTLAIKNHVLNTKFGGSRDKICPVFLLPLLIIVILVFTIAQIVMIHRTIEAYKLRDQAYRDCYYPQEGGLKNGTATNGTANSTATGGMGKGNRPWALPLPLPRELPHRNRSNLHLNLNSSSNDSNSSVRHLPLVLPAANYD